MRIHIETERLLIRDLEEYDAQGMFDLDSDPEVHEFLGKKPIKTIEEVRQAIGFIRKQYVENGIGRWAIIDKKTEDFIGWTGLKYEQELRKEFGYYDLGYRLRKKYWGKGIATETAIESLRYGFEKLDLKEISAAADVDHIASNKILKKVGLKFIETFEYEGITHNWYTITKFEWLQLRLKDIPKWTVFARKSQSAFVRIEAILYLAIERYRIDAKTMGERMYEDSKKDESFVSQLIQEIENELDSPTKEFCFYEYDDNYLREFLREILLSYYNCKISKG
ncbi:GNAT family N-acetyltransferase [Aquimarina gracilis]|uniref:GNAT family N-acetyltransferase n=1 Tax=Aquimarina gracilis TaxID=874422 RepID=A0ABU5ZT88_9FLAO|nr:GNAT family N-acetyltransferase [Aquimarina gracilis]MEB3345235.1 GNAT family N-acetyltransferase [Aquimarina gracilis]